MIRSRSEKAPDGTEWVIQRHWAPRPRWWRGLQDRARARRRSRSKGKENDRNGGKWEWLDFFNVGDIDTPIGAVLLILVAIAVVFLAVWFGWPFFVFLFDTLLFIPLVLVTILTRLVLRRPWTLEATSASGRSVVWSVGGWHASSAAAEHMGRLIRSAGDLPDHVPYISPSAYHKGAR